MEDELVEKLEGYDDPVVDPNAELEPEADPVADAEPVADPNAITPPPVMAKVHPLDLLSEDEKTEALRRFYSQPAAVEPEPVAQPNNNEFQTWVKSQNAAIAQKMTDLDYEGAEELRTNLYLQINAASIAPLQREASISAITATILGIDPTLPKAAQDRLPALARELGVDVNALTPTTKRLLANAARGAAHAAGELVEQPKPVVTERRPGVRTIASPGGEPHNPTTDTGIEGVSPSLKSEFEKAFSSDGVTVKLTKEMLRRNNQSHEATA